MSAAPDAEERKADKPTKFGPYTVVRELARGGMALVFEGRHPQLGSRVALKVMQPALAAQPMAAARFLREAKAAAQIRHQNVVEVFDVGVEGEVPYLVMEFLEGANLAELLAEKGAMPLTGIADVFLPVISAVGTAHRAGIIHRDLKPANLMISKRAPRGSHPMVLDFGISKIVTDEPEGTLTRSESLLGTVQYMAPELTKGAKFATPSSDQYALGVMLYECATGKRPFTGESYYDLMHAIVTAPVTPPSALRGALPPEFDDLVLRAMSRDPADRFPSVEALGSALLSFGDKTAWALWENEFVGTSGTDRDPWSAGPSTLDDGAPAAIVPRRVGKRKNSRPAQWALGSIALYAAIVTILLARRRPVENSSEYARSPAPSEVVPAPAPSALVGAGATRTEPTAVPVPALQAAPTGTTSPPPVMAATVPAGGPLAARPRKGPSPKDRIVPSAIDSAAPVASVTPRPASTVGTNGAPIVE